MTIKFVKTGISVACATLLALAGCGGGGSGGGNGGGFFVPPTASGSPVADTNAPAPAPGSESAANVPVTVTGTVAVVGTVSNAVVCVDRNSNNACDDGEPVSVKTGTDGVYTLTYTPTSAQEAADLLAAPLVAKFVPASIVDGQLVTAGASVDSFSTLPVAFEGSPTPLRLNAPAGKRGSVNPLTTLVQVGVASGLKVDRAEVAVGLQLGIPAADIYSYQGQNATSGTLGDNAQTMANWTVVAIQSGAELRVIDPASVTTATPSDQLATLNFTGPNDYTAKVYPTDGVVDATTGTVKFTDVRYGKKEGAAIAENVLYNRASLAPGGWTRCDAAAPFNSTLGLPSRSSYCGGATQSVGFSLPTDISGALMAGVVANIESNASTSSLFGIGPDGVQTGTTFPAGSVRTQRINLDLIQSYFINNTVPGTTDKSGFVQLEDIQTSRQVSTVNLSTGTGTQGLGLYDNTHVLRFAYMGTRASGNNTVQYYKCESMDPYNVVGACVTLGTGTATISTINGARVLELTNQPNVSYGQTRGYTEYNDGSGTSVWQVRRNVASGGVSFSDRLNGPAYKALLDALGAVAPAPSPT